VSSAALLRAIELNGVEVERNKAAFAVGRAAVADPAAVAPTPEVAQPPETLDAVIARRVEFLTAYQDAGWAEHYRSLVSRVRVAERGSEILTGAVARSLFKLMSYKDEYEVARLHVGTDFLGNLARDFAGDFKLTFHLAPPLLTTGHDARGRPRKIALGGWLKFPLRLLARMKFLRGTAFDPFGYTKERTEERALIVWYEELIALMLRELSRQDAAALAPIAEAAMDIRGYGPVKMEAIANVRARVTALVAQLHGPELRKAS